METTNPNGPDPTRAAQAALARAQWAAVCQRPDSTPLEREVAFAHWLAAAHRQAMERRQAA